MPSFDVFLLSDIIPQRSYVKQHKVFSSHCKCGSNQIPSPPPNCPFEQVIQEENLLLTKIKHVSTKYSDIYMSMSVSVKRKFKCFHLHHFIVEP